MTEQEEFFSPSHDRLLAIAVWAKYLAWGALIYFIIQAGLVVFQYQADLHRMQLWMSSSPTIMTLKELFQFDPLYYSIDVMVDIVSALLRGVIYYVVLRSVSLALYMIVETDVNYREQERKETTQ